MRKELQNRHQDITNDVNQYTTCIANYLGVQIISRFPDTTTGPLSSLCRQLLGLNGRRLEDGTEGHQNDAPFNIKVAWGNRSIVKQQQASMEMESDILEMEERILKALSKIGNRLGVNCANSRYDKKYDLTNNKYTNISMCRCELEETNINCPHDCNKAEFTALSTKETMATCFKNIKFTIKAKRKVALSSLSFFTRDAQNSTISISTMQGEYAKAIFSLDHWQNVLRTKVTTTEYNGGTASPMKFGFNQGIQITVDGGKHQSFEISSDSCIMVQMSGNMTEDEMAHEDDALQILTGREIDTQSPGPIQFSGIIGYDGLAKVPETPMSNSQGDIATDQASPTELVLEQEMKSTKRKIAAIQRKVGQIYVQNTKLNALDEKLSSLDDKMNAQDDKMSALDDKMSALDEKMNTIEGMLKQILEKKA